MSKNIKRKATPTKMEAKNNKPYAPPEKAIVTNNTQICPPSYKPSPAAQEVLKQLRQQILKHHQEAKDILATPVTRSPATIGKTTEKSPKNTQRTTKEPEATKERETTKADELNVSAADSTDTLPNEGANMSVEIEIVSGEDTDSDDIFKQLTGNKEAKGNLTAPTKQQNQPKVPRIVIPSVENANNIILKAISAVGNEAFTTSATANKGISFQCNTTKTQGALLKLFADLKLNAHTQSSDTRYRITIKGLHPSTPQGWISYQLSELGHTTCHIANIIGNITGQPTNAFKVDLVPEKNNKEVLKITKLGTYKVTIEEPNRTQYIIQCRKCQEYGHGYDTCKSQSYVCFKCAEPHPSNECTKPRNVNGKCANCKGAHVAIFRGCPIYKEALRNLPIDNQTKRASQAISSLGWMNEQIFSNSLKPEIRGFSHNQMDMLRAHYPPSLSLLEDTQIQPPLQSRPPWSTPRFHMPLIIRPPPRNITTQQTPPQYVPPLATNHEDMAHMAEQMRAYLHSWDNRSTPE